MSKQHKKCLKKSKFKTESQKQNIFLPYLFYHSNDNDFKTKLDVESKSLPTINTDNKKLKKSVAGIITFFFNDTKFFQSVFLNFPKITHDLKYKANNISTRLFNSIDGLIDTANHDYTFINYICCIVVFIFTCHQIRNILASTKITPKNIKKINDIKPQNNIEDISLTKYANKCVGDDFAVIDESDNFVGGNDIPYKPLSFSEMDMQKRSQLFYETMKLRRSIRCFSNKSVPLKVIQNIIKTAGTSPSGSNNQPWLFCIIGNEEIKIKIREILENEEQKSYTRRMGAKWVLNVNDLTINWNKPYLTEAPYLIVVMKQRFTINNNGERTAVNFSDLSCSISVGFLIAALHNAGLCTVPVCATNGSRRIKKVLHRPPNEEVLLVLPIGYPADQALVPDIKRKRLEDITRIY
uniref:Nitroreductase domain-containing protein n=1 Tax=Parastrongyloides trichosuri TaxID=131310 RepID=A0A0N4ZBC5_PARTI